MLNAIYPDELRASAPAPDPDRQQVARWFMHERKLGQGAANNKAAFYFLLASGELQKSVPAEKREQKHKKTETASSLEPRKKQTAGASADSQPRTRIEPNIQLNIQIHISADATKEQIDAIFASMATHLRR